MVETLLSDSDDGDKFYFFDLVNGKLIWESVRSAGNIESFHFHENKKILTISYGDFFCWIGYSVFLLSDTIRIELSFPGLMASMVTLMKETF